MEHRDTTILHSTRTNCSTKVREIEYGSWKSWLGWRGWRMIICKRLVSLDDHLRVEGRVDQPKVVQEILADPAKHLSKHTHQRGLGSWHNTSCASLFLLQTMIGLFSNHNGGASGELFCDYILWEFVGGNFEECWWIGDLETPHPPSVPNFPRTMWHRVRQWWSHGQGTMGQMIRYCCNFQYSNKWYGIAATRFQIFKRLTMLALFLTLPDRNSLCLWTNWVESNSFSFTAGQKFCSCLST